VTIRAQAASIGLLSSDRKYLNNRKKGLTRQRCQIVSKSEATYSLSKQRACQTESWPSFNGRQFFAF